ncbi:MAG TPA: response regulator transcription factor [Terriglobales bacterium]|nr:response regulator transcription factor [Terriglobales bacterium]
MTTGSNSPNPAERIRVLVSDDTRLGIQLMLETLRQDARFEVLGVASVAEPLSFQIAEFKPHVTVISAGATAPGRAGFDLLWHALHQYPKLQAVMLLDSSTHESVVEAFRAGARGIVCWDDGLDVLRECVHAVYLGQIWASNAQLGLLLEVFSRRWTPQVVVDSRGQSLLSKRELDVVRCVSEGMTNREIASRLKLSEHTVKNYLFRTFDKLGVSNRAELILYALNHSGSLRGGEQEGWTRSAVESSAGMRATGTEQQSKARRRPQNRSNGSSVLGATSVHYSRGFGLNHKQ